MEHRRSPSTLTACLAVCAGYTLAGAVGVWLLHHILRPDIAGVAPTIGIPWLAVGIGVAGLMLFGTRAWPGIFAGSCLTWGVIQHDNWGAVLIDAAGESISIVLIARLLRAWDYRPSLNRYQDALILITAVAIGRLVSSGIDVLASIAAVWLDTRPNAAVVLAAAGVGRNGGFLVVYPALFAFAARWWANSTVGVVLVVPLLAFLKPVVGRRRPGTGGELGLWVLAATVWLVVSLTLPGSALRLPLLAAALVLVVWAALRFGVAVASVGTLVFSMTATVGFGLQLGTFAGIRGREGVEIVWGFVGLLAGAALFLTALLSGLEESQRQIAESFERYRRLFFANPRPMWAEEVATGRIVVVNTAAVRAYGYTEDEFLRQRSGDLDIGREPVSHIAGGAGHPFAATHRTASGRALDVEMTSVPMDLDGTALNACVIDVVGEQNDLRLAILNATDHERQGIGRQIRDRLDPLLTHLGSVVDELVSVTRRNEPINSKLLASIERDSVAATAVCRELSRGASVINYVSGDLIEALHRLPEELAVAGGPEILVDVHSLAPARLPLERCEHVYSVVREALRMALLRSDVRSVHFMVNVTTDALEVTVEDDGKPQEAEQDMDTSTVSAMSVRAAAAHARLDVGPGKNGGHRVRIECLQAVDAPQPAIPPQPAANATAVFDEPRAPVVGASGSADNGARAWLYGLLLILAYVAAGAVGLRYLQYIDTRHVSFMPPLSLPWVANGIAVVGLLLGGQRLAPAVFVASVALWGGLAHDPWIAVLVDAAGEMLCAILVVRLLTRWSVSRNFDRLRDLVLLVIAAAAGRTVAAVADIVALHLTGVLAPNTLTPAMLLGHSPTPDQLFNLTREELSANFRWWINGVAGIALFVPVFAPVSGEVRRALAGRWQEATRFALVLGLTVVAIAVGPSSNWHLALLGLSLVLVAWSAVRVGVAGASATTLMLSLAATVGYGLGRGPFGASSSVEGAEILWGFIGLLAATGLFLTTVIANYEKTLRNLKELKARFEALFEALPMPLFVYSEATGRITMVNAAAIRKYGHPRAQFLDMTPDALDAGAMPPGAPAEAGGLRDRMKTSSVHRARSGAKFEVEQSVTPVNVGGETENLCFVVDVTERNDLRRRLLEASDVERRRLAHDLHDGLGQILTGLSLGITTLRRVMERGGTPGVAAIEFVAEAIREARQTCDQILHGLSPLEATGGDLLAALRSLPMQIPPESRDKLEVEIRAESALTVTLPIRAHLYQIARECVNNALKHAHATRILVSVGITSAFITLAVEDDGVGFDPAAARSAGLGLQSLALRADAVHGRLSVKRRKEGGMEISCRCPQPAL